MYHHPEDGKPWPAMVLEVAEQPGGELPPDAISVVCYLQIFRPRGNDWKRCTEGTNPGQWSARS